MVAGKPGKGDGLTQTARETFDSRVRAVTSRQHSVLVRFALRERQGKPLCECRTMERC